MRFGLALGFYALCTGLVACGARGELFPPGHLDDSDASPPNDDSDASPPIDGSPTDAPAASATDAADAGDTSPATADAEVPDTSPNPPPSADPGSTCTFDYDGAAPTVIPSVNAAGVQNVPAGVTPTASSILIQQGNVGSACEYGLSLLIADQMPPGSGIYQTSPLTLPYGMDTAFEENVTLTSDGLTIIGLNEDDTGFVTTTRSAIGNTDFGPPIPGLFAQIKAAGDGQTLWAPVLSADTLAFYYTVHNDPDAEVNGIYESLRASPSAPFPLGTQMPALIQNVAQYVTALTADRLTIFLEENSVFGTVAMTRATLADPFTNPNPMPALPGLRIRPINGCAQLLGSCGTAGCSSEQICTWPAP